MHRESPTAFHLAPPPDSRLTEDEMAQVFAGDRASDWAQAQQDDWS